MNELKETVKYLRKEHIYRNYILLINNKKEYDKITRYQMVLEIYQQYNKNPELIYEVCSTEELLFLKKIVENKIVENKIVESELIYTLDDYNVYKSLVHKFLISYISPKNIMQVPIELNDSIKGALKDFHEDKSREKDNLNYLIIGLIRIYYILSIDEIYDYVNQHHNISYVDFTNYLENNLYLKRYIISAINQDREKLYYSLEYHEFLDDVLEYLDKNDYHFNHDFKYEEIISIGKHGLNLEDKDIKKLYNLILKKITVLFKAQQFLEDFILIASLNDSKNYARLIEYLTFNDEDINISNKLIEVMNNAYNKMPSWRNSGVPPYYARESINKKNQETQFIIDSRPKIGRNDPCPCGSGQKYKKCCLNKKKDPIENIVLTSEDSSLFYELLTQLCAFTNQKHNIINQNLTPDAFYNKNKTVKTELLLEIKDKLWNDKEIIKEFIMANPYNLDCESLEIVKSWDKRITKMFIIYKYIDGKAILFDRDNIYEVSGIVSAISELYPISKLPTAIYTTLLPFKDQIIYDGMIASYDEKFDFIKPEVLNKMFELKKDKIIKKL